MKKIVTQKESAYAMTCIQLKSCGVFIFWRWIEFSFLSYDRGRDTTLNLKEQSFFQSIYIKERKLYPLRQGIIWQV
jgi:hypothetical protein